MSSCKNFSCISSSDSEANRDGADAEFPFRFSLFLPHLNLNLNLNFIELIDNIITKLLAPATSKMTNRGGGKGYTLTTREKLNTTN